MLNIMSSRQQMLLAWTAERAFGSVGRRRTRQALRTEPMFACDAMTGQDLRANNLNHHQNHFLRCVQNHNKPQIEGEHPFRVVVHHLTTAPSHAHLHHI